MPKIKSNHFLESALEEIPRLLGQLNRNRSSQSYGSFDRAYWHYRTNDISCARYQEAVYTLTLLYCSDFEGNEYYRDEVLFKWILASLRFTLSLQKKDGSFDEWYVNEGSYVATAFLTAALGETLLLLKDTGIHLDDEQPLRDLLKQSARFLIRRQEKTVLNQVSGAIFAVAVTGYVCNEDAFLEQADVMLNKFISEQSEEGWWSEYGGPDIGYLSLTISYLEKYQRLTRKDATNPAVTRAKHFLKQFINPDLTAGGEHMSRNTEYIIPSLTLPFLGTIGPKNLDDRYLCYILYNWIETGLKISPQTPELPFGEHFFPNSTLFRVMNKEYFLVTNGSKGGAFRLYAGGKVYYDSGLEISSVNKCYSTGILDHTNHVSFKDGTFYVTGFAKIIKEPLLKTVMAIVFKSWQLLFGRIGFLQGIVKHALRQRMVSYAKGSHISFKRTIEFDTRAVTVTDVVCGVHSRNDILLGLKSAYNAVPSSKYVAVPEIARCLLQPHFEERKNDDRYIIKRFFSFHESP